MMVFEDGEYDSANDLDDDTLALSVGHDDEDMIWARRRR
jgi:hypothetical protein